MYVICLKKKYLISLKDLNLVITECYKENCPRQQCYFPYKCHVNVFMLCLTFQLINSMSYAPYFNRNCCSVCSVVGGNQRDG